MFPTHLYATRDGLPREQSGWPTFASANDLLARHAHFRDHALRVLGCSPSTNQWYRNGVASLLAFLGDAAAREIIVTPDLLEEWIAWMRARSLTAPTLRTYWNSVKRFVRSVALQDGTCDPYVSLRTPGVPVHVYKALPPNECERVIATAMNYPWRTTFERLRNTALLATALYAGLRKSEVLRLLVTDVNLADGAIHVERGKGRHGGKSRTAYAPFELRQILERYLHERQRRRVTAPELFVSLMRQGPAARPGLSSEALKRVVDRVKEASGVSFSMHVLRHSFVTMLLRSGVPIHVAKELAGHTNIKTTDGYARVFSEDMRRHVEAVRFDTLRSDGTGRPAA